MPENSLAAVSYAVASGAHGAEVDISASSDNVLVVHHDLLLSSDLTCDNEGQRLKTPVAIRSLTATALGQYDIGLLDKQSGYGKRFSSQASIPNTRIPTLRDFIERVLDVADDHFVLNIELKGSPENPDLVPNPGHYIDLLLATLFPFVSQISSFSNRLFIQSFDWRLMKELIDRDTGFLCGLLTDQQSDGAPRIPVCGEKSPWTAHLDLEDFESIPHMVKSVGAGVWSSQFNDLNLEAVQEAHRRGLAVYCWTVNEIEDMKKMISLGVDVITTDYPERLVQLLHLDSASHI